MKKNITKNKIVENRLPNKLPTEIKSEFKGQNSEMNTANEQNEKDLNSKILKITMRIKEHYPELSKYLEEMPMPIQSENDPEITLNHLKTYYESLNSLMNKYKVDYPKTDE